MSHGHFKTVCSCGAVLNQCRCMDPRKTVTVVENGCAKCKATPKKPSKDKHPF